MARPYFAAGHACWLFAVSGRGTVDRCPPVTMGSRRYPHRVEERGRFERLVVDLRRAGCVFAEEEAALLLESAGSEAALDAMLAERVSGTPLEHVLGWVEFGGLRLAIGPGVFVPRQRTTFLVDEAVRRLAVGGTHTCVVVDLCCGCGAIGAAIAHALRDVRPVELVSSDVDPVSLTFARRNVAAFNGLVMQGDMDSGVPESLHGRVDALVANVPYVPSGNVDLMPREARLYEPLTALDGGADGTDLQRRLAQAAPAWLGGDGFVLVETSEAQSALSLAAFGAAGLTGTVLRDDNRGATIVLGRLTVR